MAIRAIYGALVGQSVTFNGTPAIHYDHDLWKASFSVVDTPYDVSKWQEPSAAGGG